MEGDYFSKGHRKPEEGFAAIPCSSSSGKMPPLRVWLSPPHAAWGRGAFRKKAGEGVTTQGWNSQRLSRLTRLSDSCPRSLHAPLCPVTSPLSPCPSLPSSKELLPVFQHAPFSCLQGFSHAVPSVTLSLAPSRLTPLPSRGVSSHFLQEALPDPVRPEHGTHLSQPCSHFIVCLQTETSVGSAQDRADRQVPSSWHGARVDQMRHGHD